MEALFPELHAEFPGIKIDLAIPEQIESNHQDMEFDLENETMSQSIMQT